MRFRNCFCINSLCGPSRATILTGLYSHLNGVRKNGDTFDGAQATFAKLLQKAGYQTAVVGKWHLKSSPTGFDFWQVLPGQGRYFNPQFIKMGERVTIEGYTTDIITDLGIEWLSKHRDPNRPFCLLVQHKAPHANWEAPAKYHLPLKHKVIAEPDNFHDDYQGRSANLAASNLHVGPYQWQLHYQGGRKEEPMPAGMSEREARSWVYQRYIKDYLACIVGIDRNIGRLMDHLDKTGLTDNTIVIYTSDQGFFLGEHGLYDKRLMYEESLRLPLMVRWPGVIAPGSANSDIVLNLDCAQTILDVAGVKAPSNRQGRGLLPLLRGKPVENWRTAMLYRCYEKAFGIGPIEGVRTPQYKLIHWLYGDEAWELYDLKRDPHEMTNLYHGDEHQAVVRQLQAELVRLKRRFRIKE